MSYFDADPIILVIWAVNPSLQLLCSETRQMAQRPPLLTPSTSVDNSAVAGPGTDHQQNQQNYSNSAPPNNASLSNFAGTLFKSTKRFTVSQFTCQTFRKIRGN